MKVASEIKTSTFKKLQNGKFTLHHINVMFGGHLQQFEH